MFIDFVALLLLNMTAGLVVLGWFLLRGLTSEDNKAWAPAFAAPGLVALVFGGVMATTWPLPGVFNIAFGEMSVMFGVTYLAAAWALAKGWCLRPVAILALVAGAYAILVGEQIIRLKLTMAPIPSGIGFILTGAAGALLGLVLCLKKAPIVRLGAAAVVLVAAAMWGYTTCAAIRGHLASHDFQSYKPALMKQADAEKTATQPAPRATTVPAAPAE
ncbi:MAG: DUF981 domain-containing protein [Planctomycetota bacterium]|nr:DUF981 domain-containing protein [Planctomycetota bacterium]